MKKRFFTMQVIIFVMLTVCLIGTTFSWSRRMYDKVGFLQSPMTLSYTATVNGNDCTAKTYRGTMGDDGKVIYDMTEGNEITSFGGTNGVQMSAGNVLYFKTAITNSANVPTNTTLSLNLKYAQTLYDSTNKESRFKIGVLSPAQDLCPDNYAELNAYYYSYWVPVVSQFEVAENGTAFIEWYIEFDEDLSGTGSFAITDIIFANN